MMLGLRRGSLLVQHDSLLILLAYVTFIAALSYPIHLNASQDGIAVVTTDS